MDMKSPLFDWHLAQGAKLADFGGWDMPIEYPQGTRADLPGGVLMEHAAVREKVGIFDVSHLGKMSVVGPGAKDFVNSILTNDLAKISAGSAQYNLICNEDGKVLDDLIVYEKSPNDIFIIPNAANCQSVFEVFRDRAPNEIVVTNLHQEFAVLAVQGPQAAEVLTDLGISVSLDYMAFTELVIPGHEDLGSVIICRTGYSGEFGFELLPSWQSAPALWKLLVASVEARGGRVCGLGSRDTLRTEMGYPLHGHELSLDISALQGGASWAIALDKATFIGKEALVSEKARGVERASRALLCSDRGIPRAGMAVQNLKGDVIGEVTSGTFSPNLKTGIALALIKPEYKSGSDYDQVMIDVRGRLTPATVVKLPFVASHVR
jgi:aminomethyltransferase